MNESEATCRDWLDQIGATEICFVVDQHGPPDFEASYRGEPIAVEVTRTKERIGWPLHWERAFAKQLEKCIEEISNKARNCPRWHASCVYDPKETRPPKANDRYWRDQVRKALQQIGHGGEFHLLPEGKINGRGVRLSLDPANDEGSFTGVHIDEAIRVASELGICIAEDVKRKAIKAQKKKQLNNYNNRKWWLVLSDEICMSYPSDLRDDSIDHIRQATQRSDGIDQWSKVVLLARPAGVDPSERPVHFISLWEDRLQNPLP